MHLVVKKSLLLLLLPPPPAPNSFSGISGQASFPCFMGEEPEAQRNVFPKILQGLDCNCK